MQFWCCYIYCNDFFFSFYHVPFPFYPSSDFPSSAASVINYLGLISILFTDYSFFCLPFIYGRWHLTYIFVLHSVLPPVLCYILRQPFFSRHPSYSECVPCKYLQTQFVFPLKTPFYHHASQICCKIWWILSLLLSHSLLLLFWHRCPFLFFVLCLHSKICLE